MGTYLFEVILVLEPRTNFHAHIPVDFQDVASCFLYLASEAVRDWVRARLFSGIPELFSGWSPDMLEWTLYIMQESVG